MDETIEIANVDLKARGYSDDEYLGLTEVR
jgi:hypothetical protein